MPTLLSAQVRLCIAASQTDLSLQYLATGSFGWQDCRACALQRGVLARTRAAGDREMSSTLDMLSIPETCYAMITYAFLLEDAVEWSALFFSHCAAEIQHTGLFIWGLPTCVLLGWEL